MSRWKWRGDHVFWAAEGATITRLAVDAYQVGLVVATVDRSILVTLQRCFEWRNALERTHIDPQTRDGVERLLAAVDRRVDSLLVIEPGHLTLSLEGSMVLKASPADVYESWNLCGEGRLEGLRYVAASGGIVRWEPFGSEPDQRE